MMTLKLQGEQCEPVSADNLLVSNYNPVAGDYQSIILWDSTRMIENDDGNFLSQDSVEVSALGQNETILQVGERVVPGGAVPRPRCPGTGIHLQQRRGRFVGAHVDQGAVIPGVLGARIGYGGHVDKAGVAAQVGGDL